MKEEYYKTKYEEISLLSKTQKCKTSLIKNKDTQEIAVKKEMPEELFEVYSKLAKLSSENKNTNFVKVFACYKEDGKCISVEEYIKGESLNDLMNKGGVPVNQALGYMIDLCDALEVVHKEGIIHRDIQPKNIMIENGHAMLIDFDIARNKKEESDKDTQILGTVGYAAPEQYGFAQTDERSDIYSLGKVLEEMVGRGHSFDYIIFRCLEIEPGSRYQNVKQLKKDLKREKEHLEIPSRLSAKGFIRTIPGFGSGKISTMILSVIIHAFCLYLLIGLGVQTVGSVGMKIYASILYVLTFLFPYAYIANIGHFADKFPAVKYKSTFMKWGVRILFAVAFFIIFLFIMALTVPAPVVSN